MLARLPTGHLETQARLWNIQRVVNILAPSIFEAYQTDDTSIKGCILVVTFILPFERKQMFFLLST